MIVVLPKEVHEAAREEGNSLERAIAVDVRHERRQLIRDIREGRFPAAPRENPQGVFSGADNNPAQERVRRARGNHGAPGR